MGFSVMGRTEQCCARSTSVPRVAARNARPTKGGRASTRASRVAACVCAPRSSRIGAKVNDTHPAAAAFQLRLLRQAGPARRAQLCLSLSGSVIGRSRAALRATMPDACDREVELRWVELNYGAELADRVRRYLSERAR